MSDQLRIVELEFTPRRQHGPTHVETNDQTTEPNSYGDVIPQEEKAIKSLLKILMPPL